MADKTIGQLPALERVQDDSLIPVEQNGAAGYMTGEQFADWARESVDADLKRAEDAAKSAEMWASKAPFIGENGEWQIYDAEIGTFIDSGAAAQGPRGEQGPQGETGPQGIPGTAAERGATFTPSISDKGVLSWRNDSGLENPDSVDLVAAVLVVPDAEAFARRSESYAVGGTGTRQYEDTDNAKYYAERAGYSAETAVLEAHNAEILEASAAESAERAQAAYGAANAQAGFALQYAGAAAQNAERAEAAMSDKLSAYGKGVNLLDNWCFANPVNQRGEAEYSAQGYAIDRWYLRGDGNTLTLVDGGVKLTKTGTASAALNQRLESPENYIGKVLTVSVLVTDASFADGDIGARLDVDRANSVGLNSLPLTFQWQNEAWAAVESSVYIKKPGLYSATYYLDTLGDYTGLNFGLYMGPSDASQGSHIVVAAAKLELGDTQTLAHQDSEGNWVLNDPPPDKALESLKCMRYQLEVNAPNSSYAKAGGGNATSETAANIIVPLPVPLAQKPAIIMAGTWNLRYGATSDAIAVTKMAVDQLSANCISIKCTASGLTTGNYYSLVSGSGSGHRLLIDANL